MDLAGVLAGGGVGAIVTFVLGLLAWPKLRAEAHKLEADADLVDYTRIAREVRRLEGLVRSQGKTIDVMRRELDELAKCNLDLELDVRRKAARIAELEGVAAALHRAVPIYTKLPPEQQDLIDKLGGEQ